MLEKVVITGMGTINSIGHNLAETWRSIVNGVAGVARITHFDPSALAVQIACEVKNFNPADYLPLKDVRRWDRFEHFALIAANEAMEHSGLEITEENAGRIGTIISSSGGGIISMQNAAFQVKEEGPGRLSPFSTAKYMSSGGASLTSINFGSEGPCFSIESACASGADGIGVSWMMIRSGVADAVISGASDASICEIAIGGLERSGAMSRINDAPMQTPRPFDLNRDGLVMGEGAAVLVLESESFARARGATIYAELAGYGITGDAFHITAPLEDGRGAAKAMELALQAAEVNLDEVDYINAHGTATRLNDVSETRAIKRLFGDLAMSIPISSTKSMTGHMMGVTPAIEAIFSTMALRENVLPPTIHYETPDPDCDLDYVPNEAREQEVSVVVSNAFGFGGHNSVLVFKEYR